jgi:hypothetical protein
MKGASGQVRRVGYIWKVHRDFSLSERRTAGTRVTGCVRVRLVARTSDNRASSIQELNINLLVWNGGVAYPNYLPLRKVGSEALG